MSSLKNKFIGNNVVEGRNFRLKNNEFLRSRNSSNLGDIDVIRVTSSNEVELLNLKLPINGKDAASKIYVDTSDLNLLPLSGERSMSGDLNLGTKNIINVGLVDNVKVATHADRHLPNGADPIQTSEASSINTSSINSEGVSNSLSRSDHTHDVEVIHYKVEATNSVSTSSSSPSILGGMQSTPPAGTYLVLFSGNIRTSGGGNSRGVVSFFVGNSQLTSSIRDINLQVSMALGLIGTTVLKAAASFLVDVITVNGSQQVDVRYNSTQGTTYCDGRVLVFVRLK